MNVQVLQAEQLDAAHLAAWSRIQRSQPLYDSPFFNPEFTLAIASVRQDVRIAVLTDGRETVGFFPFQQSRWRTARPVGAGFSQFHAPLMAADFPWNIADLLRQIGLRHWAYDHLPTAIAQFDQSHERIGDSYFIDLSGGFEAYSQARYAAGSHIVEQTIRKQRKLLRDHPDLHFELHTTDSQAFESLLTWKRMQHHRTGVFDVFRRPWVLRLLETIRDADGEHFHGVLSALYARGRPIAVHLGLCNEHVAHMWYPAYDVQFAPYSPGILLFLEMARAFAARGVRRMDFGPGGQRFKQSLASGSLPVAIGVAERSRWKQSLRRGWSATRAWVRSTPLAVPARVPARWMFRFKQWLAWR